MIDLFNEQPIVLASASPRRAEILKRIGIPFEVIVSHCDENVDSSLPPADQAIEAARMKARIVEDMTATSKPILSCDTIVVLGNKVFGKPKDADEALSMLLQLSGRTHQVISGVCIIHDSSAITFYETTDVTFFELPEPLIKAYIKTGEPFDKAGGYGIQDRGSLLVKRIDGDYYNVVGLPISRIVRTLLALSREVDI